MTSKVSVVSSNATLSSTLSDKRFYLNGLRRKTKAWLQIPISAWRQQEASRGRFLIREWSEVNDNSNKVERAVQQSKIIRRWVEELKAGFDNDREESINCEKTFDKKYNNGRNEEMVEMLNRCLDSWRKAGLMSPYPTGDTTRNRNVPQLESMSLIHLFNETSKYLNNRDLLPNRKTYSMCMNVLSLHPQSPTACDDVLLLYQQCRSTTMLDQQFYNVCMHTLAKCAAHHTEAPILVERIFREMTTSSDLIPNTSCFVSVLHAWTNSIPSAGTKHHHHRGRSIGESKTTTFAAERAESILNQMIRDYPQLVDTICFNICIDAWGKQGHPERAEAILWRLYQYHQNVESENKNEASIHRAKSVRPNNISFNSAINAWSKSAKAGGHDCSNGQKAADRAGELFQQMKAQDLNPTPETFGSVMEAYMSTKNPGVIVENFLNELEKMYSEGIISFPPPKVCYLMAIRASSQTKPEGVEKAEALIRRMEEVCAQGGDRTESKPCTIIYTALISAWRQSDKECAPDRAQEIFWGMVQRAKSGRKNIFPNNITLNTVLDVFCSHGRIDEARAFLATAKRVIRPDSKSYMILLKAYAKSGVINDAEKAQDLLWQLEDDYRRRKDMVKPTLRMYSQLFVAWGNSPKSDAAFRAEDIFWLLIKKDAIQPNIVIFNCVLRAWSKSSEGGAPDRAEALLQKVRDEYSEEILIDPISHLHLIYAWAHSRRKKAPKQAQKHLEEARTLCRNSGKRSDWKLTRAHFNGTILAWKKSNDRNAALHIKKLQDERDSIFGR
eukprot:CAMPEP_0197186990 /NCGR_PEP_ID=MMETSP1423-20130617/15025_1 /TAXON_ID=476441 /ORGANISM="Pseudo-nitzschia heimii, Strain UNC1101" /LENGTH=782 /DNA_ID=CAMNT_0042638457 /DNA_START=439 /DNA_END=2787 /DNA_ORIENTATION=-